MPWVTCNSYQTAQRTSSWPEDSADTPKVAPTQASESNEKLAKKPFCSVKVVMFIIVSWSAGVSWSSDDAKSLIHSPFDCTWSGTGPRITLQQHKNVAVSHMCMCNNSCTAEIISMVHASICSSIGPSCLSWGLLWVIKHGSSMKRLLYYEVQQ